MASDAFLADAGRSTCVGGALRRFFEARIAAWQLTNPGGKRSGLVTGDYAPLLHGSRPRSRPQGNKLVPNYALADINVRQANYIGGAIRGGVRADYFWGFGADAGS